MRIVAAALLFWAAVAAAPVAALTRASGLAAGAGEVSLKLDGPAAAKLLALDAPMRLVVDLSGVDATRQSADGSGAVSAARLGQFDATTARLVITLSRPMKVATATTDDNRRLTIRLTPTDTQSFAAAVKRGRAPLALTGTASPPLARPQPPTAAQDFDLPDGVFGSRPKLSLPPFAGLGPVAGAALPRSGGRKPLVVVDAGHGGKDVGAISLDGGYEKDVTLAIARVVAKTLSVSGKVRVKLTRADDRFIPLGGRVAIARAARADLFVSIHADSAPNPLARGASVYTLSDTASDAVAARLAARENKADIIGGVNFGIEADVGDVMIALMRRNTVNTAIGFAETLQSQLDDRIAFRGEFHHFAGFLVLRAADVPSVLLETGYVSNEEDAKLLFSKAGQKTVGEGVARAIEAHFGRAKFDEQYLSAPRD